MTDNPQDFPDGTLMIRDNGASASPNVEFWFYAANQTINYGFIEFEKVVNNVTTAVWIGLGAHAGWVQVSTDNAFASQYVSLELDSNLGIANRGSSDPDYPYVTTVYVSRPSVPDPPSRPYLFNISVGSVNVGWEPPDNNGGATITGYQVGYGQNSSSPTTIINANSGVSITNLPTGTLTFFWVRAQNYEGFSNWSDLNSARTFLGAYVKTGGVWKLAIPYVNVGGLWREAEPVVHHS